MQENRALCMNYSANRSRSAVRFQCSWKHSMSDRPLKAHDEYKSFFFLFSEITVPTWKAGPRSLTTTRLHVHELYPIYDIEGLKSK